MLSAFRSNALRAPSRVRYSCMSYINPSAYYDLIQAFSTSRAVKSDMAKLVLIGRLGGIPESKVTKNDKEYVQYVFHSLLVE